MANELPPDGAPPTDPSPSQKELSVESYSAIAWFLGVFAAGGTIGISDGTFGMYAQRPELIEKFTQVERKIYEGSVEPTGNGFREVASLSGDSWLSSVESPQNLDRKSTRLNSSHTVISYAVFCLK